MSTPDDLTRLVRRSPPEKKLDAAVDPLAIRAKTGLERKSAGKVSSTVVTVESTDGLFTFVVKVVK